PPWAHVCRTLLERPDCRLPVEAILVVRTFEVVPAGEAQETRLHRREQFHDVRAVAVRTVLIGGREERYQTEPDRSATACGDHEPVGSRRSELPGLQRRGVLSPLRSDARKV